MFPRKLRFTSRSQSKMRHPSESWIYHRQTVNKLSSWCPSFSSRKLHRDHDQRSNTLTVEKWKVEHRYIFFFFFLSFSLPSFSFSETLARVIPLLRDYRRRHSSKSRFTPRLRRKEQRWSTEGRGKRGTKRHDCVPACVTHRLWPFVNFRGNESFTEANRRGLKLLAIELCREGFES